MRLLDERSLPVDDIGVRRPTLINGVRSLMQGGTDVVGIGHSTGYCVVLSLVWCAAILVVFSVLATARFSRTQ